MLNTRYEILLIPYLEGTLDPQRRAMLEEQIAHDNDLALEIESLRRLKYRLQLSASGISAARTGRTSRWPAIKARMDQRQVRTVRPPIWWGVGMTAGAALSLAACLAISGPFSITGTHSPGARLGSTSSGQGMNNYSAPKDAMVPFRGDSTGMAAGLTELSQTRLAPFNNQTSTGASAAAIGAVPAFLPLPTGHVALRGMDRVSYNSPLRGDSTRPLASPDAYSTPFVPYSRTQDIERTYNPMAVVVPSSSAAPPTTVSANGAVTPSDNDDSSAMERDATRPLGVGGILNLPVVSQQSTAASSATPSQSGSLRLSALTETVGKPTPSGVSAASSPLFDQLRSVSDQASSDAANGATSKALARWQSVLQATTSSSIYGDDSAELVAMQCLEAIQAAGLLDPMRQELEIWQQQDPRNIGVCRMLAAVYGMLGESSSALEQRRKAAFLSAATGEDWFQVGLEEEQAGNTVAANTDYSKALQSGTLSNTMHLNFVRQRVPQVDL